MDRRSFINFLLTASVAAPVAAVTTHIQKTTSSASSEKDKDVAERILDTRQMTFSYISNGPLMAIKPNTGKPSGIFYDLTQRLGELAKLEIKWGFESTFATYTEDLRLGKCDAVACGIWPSAQKAKAANFSLPAFYSGVGVYVRKDDRRFDDNVRKLNDPRFRIATLDGEMSLFIRESDFPKASVFGLSNTNDITMLAESVVTRKADATFMEKAVAIAYMEKNPKTLQCLTDARPIRIFENTWAFPHGSERLKSILDAAMKEMIYSGYIDKLLTKFGQENSFFRVRAPIQ
jgi:polar amino acid transport system substrate-binding protein